MTQMKKKKFRRTTSGRQSGATLIIAMIMLVVLTLFVISAVKLSNVNLQIVGNYQWQKEMENATDSALEWVISASTSFGSGLGKDICQDGSVVATGACTLINPQIGAVSSPQCTNNQTATGYTKKLGELAPDDNDWLAKATATDPVTNAKVTIYRGVTVRQLAGNCSA